MNKIPNFKEETTEEDEEKDEYAGRSHNEEQNSSTIENNMDSYKNTPYLKTVAVPQYGTEQYYVQIIKANVTSTINSMHQIKESIDKCPSPMMIAYMSSLEDFYTDGYNFAIAIQNMPRCDEELKMLTNQQIEAIQQVKDTVEHYIEQYQQKFQESTNKKDEEEETLEDAKEQLQQGKHFEKDDKKQEELEADSEHLEDKRKNWEDEEKDSNLKSKLEQDDEISRKSWELSPQQKIDIQRNSQQVAQEYNEKQNNSQPEIQNHNVPEPEMEL